MSTDLTELLIYKTPNHSCSYLPEEDAATIFIDPQAPITASNYQALSDLGFRRSGEHIYRPSCDRCQQCIPLRLPVSEFTPNKNQKRVVRQNASWHYRQLLDISHPDVYALYDAYISTRHRDGDMYPPSRALFLDFLSNHSGFTQYHALYDGESLIAVAVTDHLEKGLSAIYTFFSPNQEYKSLGTYMVLWQIELAKDLGLDYVYLGYWIKQCKKMSYKALFRPAEALIRGQWLRLN
jgi:arginine-tRNA-protein transferase